MLLARRSLGEFAKTVWTSDAENLPTSLLKPRCANQSAQSDLERCRDLPPIKPRRDVLTSGAGEALSKLRIIDESIQRSHDFRLVLFDDEQVSSRNEVEPSSALLESDGREAGGK